MKLRQVTVNLEIAALYIGEFLQTSEDNVICLLVNMKNRD